MSARGAVPPGRWKQEIRSGKRTDKFRSPEVERVQGFPPEVRPRRSASESRRLPNRVESPGRPRQ